MTGSWIELDRECLLRNLETFRLRLDSHALMAVVKANAYGHGAALIAPAIRDHVDWLAVDALAEAEELRGLEKPILIFGHTETSEAERVVELGFRQALFRRDVAEALSKAAVALGRPARVHLKIETGLHRLGVSLDELEEWATFLSGLEGLEVEGAYTHFADVEDPSSTFSRAQLARFETAITLMRQQGLEPSVIHASPTAGVLLHDQGGLTLGRVGVGLYGIWPSKETRAAAQGLDLRPVLSWKCRLAQVKTVPAGATVGYDLTFRATSDRRIGVLPLGYYDGYDRGLSNHGAVLVRGRRAPIAGRVAMNMCMVDVTGIDAVAGDEVVLIGEQNGASITADEVATWADTIAYEILARIHPSLPRRFYSRA
ncbi:MAG: alanine racemase [Acidobacteria bacterium]|nr:MAG: alanine racemase [Acidobacteriota bacterium]